MASEKKDDLATVELGDDDEAPPRANPCEGLNTFLRNNAEVLERAVSYTHLTLPTKA